jgi:hypothetical protein
MITIELFKEVVVPTLENYEIKYSNSKDGDFGSLDQIEFNSEKLGGNIDFWGLGWLGVFLWDYELDEEIMNILLSPEQEEEKQKVFQKLKELL